MLRISKTAYMAFLLVFVSVDICPGNELTLEDIQVAVQHNESLLVNYEADFNDTITFADPRFLKAIGEEELEIGLFEYRFIWEGQKWWAQSTLISPKEEVLMKGLQGSGESRLMTLAYRPDETGKLSSTGAGLISSKVGPNTRDITPDRFTFSNQAGRPLSFYLKEQKARLSGWQEVDGRKVAVLEIRTENNTRMRFFLDPDRGFSVVRKEVYNWQDDEQLFLVFDNIELKELDNGLWFPISGDSTTYMTDDNGEQYKGQVIQMTVAENTLKINQKLPEDAFRVEFPTGAYVYDQVLDIRYVVRETTTPPQRIVGPDSHWIWLIITFGACSIFYFYLRHRRKAAE